VSDWQACHRRHRWVLDKLLLADRMDYVCGPAGEDVPEPGEYVVRPCVNINGMGAGASVMRLEANTDHLPLGSFWCEQFDGHHISVDYTKGFPVLVVRGHRRDGHLDRWDLWELVYDTLPLPPTWIQNILNEHAVANVEYVGGRPIEVQFHENRDFRWGNRQAVPYYTGDDPRNDMRYVPDPDGPRLGFYLDNQRRARFDEGI